MDEVKASEPVEGLDIAIIGIAGRFPGAGSVGEFWENLVKGVESISFFSDEELLASGVDVKIFREPNYVRARGILQDVDKFDASFFGFFPKEAEDLDPQHRLFMECAWEALENAGYNAEEYDGLIGTFGGVGMNTYILPFLSSRRGAISTAEGYQISIGNEKDFLTTKVSYKLNLRGPSLDVQTACSTSLVATFLACQSLLSFQSDMALAGGATISLPQKSGYSYQEGMILSPDGHCRAFDAKANGTIAGNGVAMVLLKRLEDALQDGDHIYAVIKGAACNNDGSLKVGYTAPSVEGQKHVIADAQFVAGVDPETITYIETHGTGTNLGDPIEISALTQVFKEKTDKKHFCAIGSVKTNIGHLDAAAGAASLVKTALAFEHKKIPPSINFTVPNPKIDFANSPFYVNTELADWEPEGIPRRAGVSSFGIGGTNVHLVMEEAPQQEESGVSRQHQLVLLSARSDTALANARENFVNYLRENPQIKFADAVYTLQVGRKAFNYRMAVVCKSLEDAVNTLSQVDPQRVLVSSHPQKVAEKPVAFMFSGQGAQYVNMGRDLYDSEPVFKEQVDLCCDFLEPVLGLDLRGLLYPPKEQEDAAQKKLSQTSITQPALFVIEYALAKLWMEWGVKPRAMIGHSIGEYVAACLSGVMSLQDALKVVAARGDLMQQMPPGAMLSVHLNEDDLRSFLNDDLSLAAVNAESLTVVSGDFPAIEKLESALKDKDVEFRRLHTSHAFHSPMMDTILAPFADKVREVNLSKPSIPYISNVSGTWITEEQATDPEYYSTHLRNGVRFSQGIGELVEDSDYIFLEVGPGKTLNTLTRRNSTVTPEQVILSSLHHPQESISDEVFILNTLGRIWLAGGKIDWNGFYAQESRHRIPLPTYPFERQRYWMDVDESAFTQGAPDQSKKKKNVNEWFYAPSWKRAVTSPVLVSGGESKKWLLFLDVKEVNSSLAQSLKNGDHFKIVHPGKEYDDSNPDFITINPKSAQDYERLLQRLELDTWIPDRIVHAWSSFGQKDEGLTPATIADAQDRGFKSLLYLVKEFGKSGVTLKIEFVIVTFGVFDTSGDEELYCGNATLAGASRVIPQEYPNIICRLVDLEKEFDVESDLGRIFAEFDAPLSEMVVAYRKKRRWLQTFEPLQFQDKEQPKPRLKENGVYLITGGLGDIGFLLSEFLAKEFKAKLAIVDRVKFPARDEWNKWFIEHGDSDAIAVKINKLNTLEGHGARVLVLNADVADENKMREAIRQVEEKFGGLDGVIHAAGLVGRNATRAIQETRDEECEAQFAAKIYGTANLLHILKDKKLDFVILQSSLSSILGGMGMYAYAAANSFLDAVANLSKRNGMNNWTSVNWDGWEFPKNSTESEIKTSIEEYVIEPKEGLEAFKSIFSHPNYAQIVVSTGDLNQRIRQWVSLESLREKEESEESKIKVSAKHYPRPNLPTPYVAPRNEMEKEIVQMWGELLGIEGIGIHDNFFDLGGHSLLATQLVSRLRDSFKVDLPLRDLFESPTIATLSEIIESSRQLENDKEKKIADAFRMVENLSEEEVKELLKKKNNEN